MSNVDIFNILKKYFLQGKTTAAGSAGLKLFLEWRQKKTKVFQPIVARIITI